MIQMMEKYRVRQVWLPRHSFYGSGYFPRNLSRLLEMPVEFIEGQEESVDAEVVGVFSRVPNVFARNGRKIRQFAQKLIGFPFIHGGPNVDVSRSYDMRNPPNTKGFQKRIWLTTENIRTPHNLGYDFTISFDQDNYRGSNVYGPLAYLLLTEDPTWIDPMLGKSIRTDELSLPRQMRTRSKKKLACAFIGNSHSVRLRFIDELRRYGQVDVYGSAVGRPVKNKFTVAQHYRFVICFENDLYPGYVTEKLIHGYACGAVPIYWGDLGNDRVFNKSSFVNLSDYNSIQALAYEVGNMNETEYQKTFEQPLIKDLSPLNSFKRELIDIFLGIV